jgi:hypothetical protein
MHKALSAVLLAMLASAGLDLSAQNLTGGVYTGLSLPMGDLKDKQYYGTDKALGSHVGGYLDFDLAPHHQLRAHLTFQNFPGSNWVTLGGFHRKNAFTDFQAGADWIYRFQGRGHGWYTLAGVSLNNFQNDGDYVGVTGPYSAPQAYLFSDTRSQNGRIGIRGGAGYSFNRTFSLEGTLNQVFVDSGGTNGFGFNTATWSQVSAVFRFGK